MPVVPKSVGINQDMVSSRRQRRASRAFGRTCGFTGGPVGVTFARQGNPCGEVSEGKGSESRRARSAVDATPQAPESGAEALSELETIN